MTAARVAVLSVPQTVYSEGEELCDFYVVVTGKVCVSMEERPLATLVDSSHFGEVEAFARSPRVTKVVAVDATQVIRIQQRVYVNEWPEAAAHHRYWTFLQQLPGFTAGPLPTWTLLYYSACIRKCPVRLGGGGGGGGGREVTCSSQPNISREQCMMHCPSFPLPVLSGSFNPGLGLTRRSRVSFPSAVHATSPDLCLLLHGRWIRVWE